jgi:hypothetical protein
MSYVVIIWSRAINFESFDISWDGFLIVSTSGGALYIMFENHVRS